MNSLSDDDDISLSAALEGFANSLAYLKNLTGTDQETWATLDAEESDVRAAASALTVDAVTATLESAGQSLTDLQASVKQARTAVQKIADAASALQKIAQVIVIAGSLVRIAGSISSGNVAGIVTDIRNLPGQVSGLAAKV
jgi:hypothetical protein